MWQKNNEILALDSKISHLRLANCSDIMTQETRDKLKPVYIRRRHQLLQNQLFHPPRLSQEQETEVDHPLGPIRNKRYLSLRVKLLKRQFSLPSDVLSLKSLSLGHQDSSQQEQGHEVAPGFVHQHQQSHHGFKGVEHIFDGHKSTISRLKFGHNCNMFACSSLDGKISICDLISKTQTFLEPLSFGFSPVLDLDLSLSDELLICSMKNGDLIIWDIRTKSKLRSIRGAESGSYACFCRFLPQNNNLVVCGINNLTPGFNNNNNNINANGRVKIMNISTGKLVVDGSPVIGTPTAIEMNHKGTILWIGNDKGQIESFKLECDNAVKVQKGSRISVKPTNESTPLGIMSLSVRNSLGQISCKPCLLTTLEKSPVLHLFTISDESTGKPEPLLTIDSGCTGVFLTQSLFPPILSHERGLFVISGADDGSIMFFDLGKGVGLGSGSSSEGGSCCVNKILGHSESVIALNFSQDESFAASADTSGQIIVWRK